MFDKSRRRDDIAVSRHAFTRCRLYDIARGCRLQTDKRFVHYDTPRCWLSGVPKTRGGACEYHSLSVTAPILSTRIRTNLDPIIGAIRFLSSAGSKNCTGDNVWMWPWTWFLGVFGTSTRIILELKLTLLFALALPFRMQGTERTTNKTRKNVVIAGTGAARLMMSPAALLSEWHWSIDTRSIDGIIVVRNYVPGVM